MRKKIKTTPLQREILWSLAEKGQESLLAMLQILVSKFPSDSPSRILQRVEREFGVLERLGFLYLVWQFDSEQRSFLVDERRALSVEDLIRWNETRNHWEVRPHESNFTDVIVQLTMGGVKALDLIAAESDKPTPVWKPRGEDTHGK